MRINSLTRKLISSICDHRITEEFHQRVAWFVSLRSSDPLQPTEFIAQRSIWMLLLALTYSLYETRVFAAAAVVGYLFDAFVHP